jgi:carboxyl-terminal processing protease
MHFRIKFALVGLFIACLAGCSEKGTVDPSTAESKTDGTTGIPKYQAENTWIYAQMKSQYLWEDRLPLEKNTNKNLSPEDYFYSLTNQATHSDWVSYFKNDKQEVFDFWQGNLVSYGFRYRKIALQGDQLSLAVSLVLKGSAAQKNNLWRGDIITKINGTPLTVANYSQLLALPEADFTCVGTNNETKQIKMSKTRFQTQPIQEKTVFTLPKHKVGYLAYTQFLVEAESELRQVMGDFKRQSISELVLDLRFNPGGVTPNTEVVASLLVKNLVPNTTMYYSEWNPAQTEINKKREGQQAGIRKWLAEPQNLGTLSRIFILSSKTTASSSELIINALRPFMEVVVIGDNTYGKNLISTIITDETGTFPFVLMPAYTQIFNTKGESAYGTKEGFTPNHRVEDNIVPYYPLGHPKETLLKKALSIISGVPEEVPDASIFRSVTFKDRYHHHDTGSAFYPKANL